ncbi:MAG: sulfatase, partial [Gaiellales bacterium]
TPDMQGHSLAGVIGGRTSVREAALFGIHGGHANVTDGRYVYMRACVTPDNQPLFEYTLMPTNMRGRFPMGTLSKAELVPPMSFTKGVPVLKVPAIPATNPAAFGSMLFDLQTDPLQLSPIVDDEIETTMARLLVELLREADAPPEQYVRLGLPEYGEVTSAHLVLGRSEAAAQHVPEGAMEALAGTVLATSTVRELLQDEAMMLVLREVLGPVVDGPLPDEALDMTLLEISTVTAGLVPPEALAVIAAKLA